MYTYVYIYIYMYIYLRRGSPRKDSAPGSPHVRVLPSFRQPTFQKFIISDCSAAWSAFHLKHVIIVFV